MKKILHQILLNMNCKNWHILQFMFCKIVIFAVCVMQNSHFLQLCFAKHPFFAIHVRQNENICSNLHNFKILKNSICLNNVNFIFFINNYFFCEILYSSICVIYSNLHRKCTRACVDVRRGEFR